MESARPCAGLPVVDEAVDALLPQLPPGLVVVVVVPPAENHQALRLGVADVGDVFQQLLRVAADTLEKKRVRLSITRIRRNGQKVAITAHWALHVMINTKQVWSV